MKTSGRKLLRVGDGVGSGLWAKYDSTTDPSLGVALVRNYLEVKREYFWNPAAAVYLMKVTSTPPANTTDEDIKVIFRKLLQLKCSFFEEPLLALPTSTWLAQEVISSSQSPWQLNSRQLLMSVVYGGSTNGKWGG